MKNQKQLFLFQVWQHHRLLFLLFVSFIVGQLFFTYKGVENFPFFHWGMYSAPVPKSDTLQVVSLKIENRPILLTELSDAQKSITESSFWWYYSLLQNNNTDPNEKVVSQRFKTKISEEKYRHIVATITNDSAAIASYPRWMFQYLADMRLVQNASMEARIVSGIFNKQFQFDTIKSTQAFYYAAQ